MDVVSPKVIIKKKKTRFFETYISKVLKQMSDCNGITSNAKQQFNSALCLICKLIASTVINLTEIAKKKTMSEKELNNTLLLILPEQLAKNAISEGQEAVIRFENIENIKGKSRQNKADIIFSPSIVEKFLRNFGYSKIMISSNVPIYMAGSLQYLAMKILECACISTNNNKRIRISIRDLEMGIRNDEELHIFFTKHNISFLGGGVIPFIHPSLLIKKNKRSKKISVISSNDSKIDKEDKKKHRFRPGTVCIRDIRKYQKMSDCLTFVKLPFEKMVRNIITIHNKNESMKISKNVFIVLQYFIEQQITNLLKNANFAAIHAGRIKLMNVDIDFVRAISTNNNNPYYDKIGFNELEEDDISDID